MKFCSHEAFFLQVVPGGAGADVDLIVTKVCFLFFFDFLCCLYYYFNTSKINRVVFLVLVCRLKEIVQTRFVT